MKDRLALVLLGGAGAALAWAFWHYLGSDALSTLLILALVSVGADNLRLRRALRDREGG